MITREQLKKSMPHATEANIDKFLSPLNQAMFKYSITVNNKRIAAFLAQVAHESGSLRYTEELASGQAYEGRKDLGNVEDGDGVKFKGRGLIQITGRTNYRMVGNVLGFDFIKDPEKLEFPGAASMSAAWFWFSHKLNDLADIETIESFRKITRVINGGYNGWAERLKNWEICKEALK